MDYRGLVALSSTVFPQLEPTDLCVLGKTEGYLFEFSSGLPHFRDAPSAFLSCDRAVLLHNYFPAPERPYVLNLASLDGSTLRRSIAHCEMGLMLAAKKGAPFFSAHSGFAIEPRPEDLGDVLPQPQVDRAAHYATFVDSVERLCSVAETLGVDFLLENNVLSSINIRKDRINPLFCTDPGEIQEIFDVVDHPRLGLLLDTAHLKVSATSLGFDYRDAVEELSHYVRGVHHSDNDGISDSNLPLRSDYWFLRHMPAFAHVPHVIEVNDLRLTDATDHVRLLSEAIR